MPLLPLQLVFLELMETVKRKKLLGEHDPARLWPLPLMAKCLLNISNLLLVATSRVEKMQKHQLTEFKVCQWKWWWVLGVEKESIYRTHPPVRPVTTWSPPWSNLVIDSSNLVPAESGSLVKAANSDIIGILLWNLLFFSHYHFLFDSLHHSFTLTPLSSFNFLSLLLSLSSLPSSSSFFPLIPFLPHSLPSFLIPSQLSSYQVLLPLHIHLCHLSFLSFFFISFSLSSSSFFLLQLLCLFSFVFNILLFTLYFLHFLNLSLLSHNFSFSLASISSSFSASPSLHSFFFIPSSYVVILSSLPTPHYFFIQMSLLICSMMFFVCLAF